MGLIQIPNKKYIIRIADTFKNIILSVVWLNLLETEISMKHIISSHHITFDTIASILKPGVQIELGEEARARIQKCRDYLDQKVDGSNQAHYGIN